MARTKEAQQAARERDHLRQVEGVVRGGRREVPGVSSESGRRGQNGEVEEARRDVVREREPEQRR